MTTNAYAKRFAELRSEIRPERWPSLTRHRAPHQPLLLLAVLDQIAAGAIDENLFVLDEALLLLFKQRWLALLGRAPTRANLGIPAYYLQKSGFWHLVPRSVERAIEELAHHNDALPLFNALVLGVRLDDALFNLLLNEQERARLRQILVQTYFAPEAWATLAPLPQRMLGA